MVKLAKRLLSVEDYHLMAKVGILPERGIELVNGEILETSPIGSKHAALVDKIKDLIVAQLQRSVIVRAQNPIEISNNSEPEPDIVVVKYKEDYYAEKHPQPEDVFLLIEVADSSLGYDQEIKLPLYAKAGIPEYWIINLEANRIEAYRKPGKEVYKFSEIAEVGDTIKAEFIDFTIEVKAILS